MDTAIIGNGRTADVIEYNETCVLKLFKSFMNSVFIDQEFNVASYAYQKKLPTPKPIVQINQNGRKGIVYDKIDGKSLLRLLSDNPLKMSKIAHQMAALHCQIHAVEFDDVNNTQKKNIENAIKAASGLSDLNKEQIVSYLAFLPDGRRLCHGDFHPDNIIVNEKLWIIDWMTGSSGNPLCDIARSKLILETSEIPDSVSFGMKYLLRLGQKKLAKTYVKEYCKISKTKVRDINVWLLPLYAARLVENLSVKEKESIMKKIQKEMKKS